MVKGLMRYGNWHTRNRLVYPAVMVALDLAALHDLRSSKLRRRVFFPSVLASAGIRIDWSDIG